MRTVQTIVMALVVSLAAVATAQAAVVVSYEAEAAGVENTTASFNFSAVETFDGLSTAKPYAASITQTFTQSGHPATSITMNYTGANGVEITPADQYGGAGGTGDYIVAMGQTPYGATDDTLNLSSTALKGGVNYFGFWLSALDAGNQALFYDQNGKLLTFDAADVLNLVGTTGKASTFARNPDTPFKSDNYGQPYVFVNFFGTAGSFSKIVFSKVPVQDGGFESDNQTVGNYTAMGQGTLVPLVASVPASAVPEPATCAMMLGGLGRLGLAMQARRQHAVAIA